jgi:hypothetical protein
MSYLRSLFLIVLVAILVILNSCNYTNADKQVVQSSLELTIEKDVNYMTALGLMQGHLLVGKELLDQGTPEQAEPHLGHPVNELYGEVEDQLALRNVKPFKKPLENLYDLAKYKPSAPEVDAEYANSVKVINRAVQALPSQERYSPKFILQVINNLGSLF